eukprot:CAMPEP_0204862568 /NCGR_PEP_ID=MMETSP1348-20121228/2637_1 /ASSEMBLY_ACC=CAM_ASM_000700 /TAXON_ID=215587 /ORGANISM="Aplanochytrium stocchinoi, Strain GSBS06" /LENGTH=917 /DNA_ID=CAMNT_0052012589 /DNA_START=120 /DNA_END=2870 /DNA_ORIENTATION=-
MTNKKPQNPLRNPMFQPKPPSSPPKGGSGGSKMRAVPIVPPGLKKGPRPPSTEYDPKSLPPPVPGQFKKGPRPPSTEFDPAFSKFDDDGFVDPNIDRKTGRLAAIHERKLWQRMVLAGLAISLLWATSLAVARAIVNDYFIPRPTMSDVGDSLSSYGAVMDTERASYANCARLQFNDCTDKYETDKADELQRVADNFELNEVSLDTNRARRTLAKITLNDTLNILITEVNDGLDISNPIFLNNSGEDCPRINEWVAGRAQASGAMGLLDDFNKNQTDHISSLSEALARRQAYDAEYIANKTQEIQEFGQFLSDQAAAKAEAAYAKINASLSQFKACTGFAADICPTGNIFGQFGVDIGNINASFDGMLGAYEATAIEVGSWMSNFEDLLSKVSIANTQLGNLGIPLSINTGGVSCPCSTPDLTFSGTFPPTNFDAPGDLGGNMNDLLDSVQNGLDDTFNAAKDKLQNLDTNFSDFYGGGWKGFEDYNPPPVNQNPLADWQSQSETNQDAFNNELDGYQGDNDGRDDDFVEPTQTKIDFPDNQEEFLALFPNNTRILEFYSYEPSVFNTLRTNLALVANLAVYADILFRVLHTVYLINKYWNLSNLGKPPGDARLNEISGRGWGLKATPDQKLARMLTHPVFIAMVSLLFTGLITWTAWAIYEPFFNAYVDGCVNHNAADIDAGKSTGTMIFRNFNTIGFQYAASTGDNILTAEVDKVNLIADVECEDFFTNSSENYKEQLIIQSALNEDYLESVSFNTEIKTCLNLDAIDLARGTTLGARVELAVFTDGLVEMEDAIYNCSAVGGCDFDCNDPGSVSIRNNAHRTSCTSEWWIHSTICGTTMVLLTFILLNVFRIEFVKAVVRIWWRNISPGDFSFLASCTRRGEHIDPEQVTEEGLSMRQTINQELSKALSRWERW